MLNVSYPDWSSESAICVAEGDGEVGFMQGRKKEKLGG